jgi:hypothetical protein
MDAEVHQPGFPHPVRSAFRVSHPLDGLLPPTRPGHEDRYRSWGSSLQSLSPPQSLAPSGFLALMSFLTSRPPALRTRRSRCPATPGLCSPRRSVPDSSLCARGPILSWDFVLSGRRSSGCEYQWPDTRPDTPWRAKPEGFTLRRPEPRQQEDDRIPWVRPASEKRSPGPVPGFPRRQQCPVRLLRLQVSRLRSCPRPSLRGREDREPEGPREAGS